MVSKVARVTGLINRLRSDRRLPPPVGQLLADLTRTIPLDASQRAVARARPPIGRRAGRTARLDWRRLRTNGELPMSLSELGHENACCALDALRTAGIDAFITGQRGSSIQIALPEGTRQAAWRTLIDGLASEAWFVEWTIGHRRRLSQLGRGSRFVTGARSWRLFRAYGWGDRVVGRSAAVELTFWERGTSGEIERVGTRANARYDERSASTTEQLGDREYPGRSAFPVADGLEHMRDPIDIVITWVDGTDPEWQRNMRTWAEREGRAMSDEALDPARFHNRDELRYVLRSIWAYCGWARRIYLVTADQRPSWLVDGRGVTVVSHTEILPPDALPTFNSHSIEAALHHIPGLAEHFVYFNDDMFVARDLAPEFFFTPNGLPKVFPSHARVPGYESDDTIAVDTAALRGRELLRERFGRVVTFKPHHSPYPLRTSVTAEMEKEFVDIVGRTQHSRFRSPADLSTAASFSQHYALATGRAVTSDLTTDYVNTESPRLGWHLRRLALSERFDTFCINDTAQPAQGGATADEAVSKFLAERFPVAAPWELA